MSGDNGFLSRWARRKAQAAKPQLPDPGADQDVEHSVETTVPVHSEILASFDISKLPSIDSLTSQSDLSMFMQFGVPETLRNQALRHMWVTDTSIRDYVGLSDYAWDFHTPGALPGHGELDAGTDVARLVRQFTNDLFDSEKEPPPQNILIEADVAQAPDHSDSSLLELESPESQASTGEDCGMSGDQDASKNSHIVQKRRHGGAVPR